MKKIPYNTQEEWHARRQWEKEFEEKWAVDGKPQIEASFESAEEEIAKAYEAETGGKWDKKVFQEGKEKIMQRTKDRTKACWMAEFDKSADELAHLEKGDLH